MADKALIIGLGEVGSALHTVLGKVHNVSVKDGADSLHYDSLYRAPDEGERFDFMHICFPYDGSFVQEVGKYQRIYHTDVTVVHSTVPVGTCRQVGAVHSPVIGLHPHLQQSLLTFTKFVGGEQAGEVARHLMRAGIKCYVTDKPESTELLKLLSTTFYGLCIEWTKHVKELCIRYETPFEAYTLWTQVYNEGYRQLRRAELTRPNLVPIQGKIGGHCVLPNLDMMVESEFTELIRERNR